MLEEEYILVKKSKSELQKVLNQWKHIYDFSVLWIHYDTTTDDYHALILRQEKGNDFKK